MSAGDALTGAGDVLGFGQGKSQQKMANKELAAQQQALQFAENIAQQVQQNQQQLFGTAAPAYGGLVNQLLYNAGLGGINAAGTPSPYGSFTPAAGTAADVGPNGSAVAGTPTAGVSAPASNPVLSNYQGAGAPAPAPGMDNVAATQYNAQGQQTTGYGPPRTGAPVGTLNGRTVAGFGSRKSLPGFATQFTAGTPAAPINTTGAQSPGYTGPQSTTPGQTAYYPVGTTASLPSTPTQTQPGATAGVPTNMLGIYNLPQEQLQYQAAKEDIDRATRGAANNLRFNLGVAGAGPNTIAAALQRTADQGLESQAAFRRNLATQAPQLQEQYGMNALQALTPGLAAGSNTGAGGLAAGVGSSFGQAGQAEQGAANQTFGQVGQSVGNYQQNQLMQKYLSNQGATAPAAPPTPNTSLTMPDMSTLPGRATGGPVQAGHLYEVGEAGPELLLAPTNGYVLPNNALRPTLAGMAAGPQGLPPMSRGGVSATPNLDRYIALLRGQ